MRLDVILFVGLAAVTSVLGLPWPYFNHKREVGDDDRSQPLEYKGHYIDDQTERRTGIFQSFHPIWTIDGITTTAVQPLATSSECMTLISAYIESSASTTVDLTAISIRPTPFSNALATLKPTLTVKSTITIPSPTALATVASSTLNQISSAGDTATTEMNAASSSPGSTSTIEIVLTSSPLSSMSISTVDPSTTHSRSMSADSTTVTRSTSATETPSTSTTSTSNPTLTVGGVTTTIGDLSPAETVTIASTASTQPSNTLPIILKRSPEAIVIGGVDIGPMPDLVPAGTVVIASTATAQPSPKIGGIL